MHVLHHLLLPGVVLKCVGQLDHAVAVRPHSKGARGLYDWPFHHTVLFLPRVELIVRVNNTHYVSVVRGGEGGEG